MHTVYVTLRYTGQTKRFLITTKLVHIYLGLRVVVVVAAIATLLFLSLLLLALVEPQLLFTTAVE